MANTQGNTQGNTHRLSNPHAVRHFTRIAMGADASFDASLKEALLRAFQQRFRFKKNRFQASPEPTQLTGGRGAKLSDAAWRAAGREVMALHEAYTGGGDFSHQQNPLHRHQAGYQFYYLPRNVFRIRHVLDNLPWSDGTGIPQLVGAGGSDSESPALHVLDLGCGTGAFSLALLGHLAAGGPAAQSPAIQSPTMPIKLRIVMVDQGRSLLELAMANIRAYAALLLPKLQLELEARTEGVEAYLAAETRGGGFGIVGGGMMLNEMALLAPRRGSKRAIRFLTPVMQLPQQGGLVLFVEPGTRKGYMNLMALRDQVGRSPILYPCPHDKPCPMWSAKVNRWCHATRPLPRKFAFDMELRGSGRLGFAMREINLAGFAFQQSATGRAMQPFIKPLGSRVVSSRLPPRDGGSTRKSAQEKPAEAKIANAPHAPNAPHVVLECGGNGVLKEIPAVSLGSHPRGLWLDQGFRARDGSG